jgi:hypothetical protein
MEVGRLDEHLQEANVLGYTLNIDERYPQVL